VSPRLFRAQCIYREENESSRLEIWDEDGRRSLWFDDVILQSEIQLDDPAVLPNPVNRAMLAPLMFDTPWQRVLLAGCGGGAIARWFHARAPGVVGDAVELSPTVARLARTYFDFPPPTSNWRLLVDDVRRHVAQTARRYDFILVDLEQDQATPAWTTGATFLEHCARRLAPGGTLVVNLISRSIEEAVDELFDIRQVFTNGIGLLTDPDHENLLVLARSEGPPPTPDRPALRALSARWGIDFTSLADGMRWIPPASPMS
jgi:spermidine synthase